MEKISFASPYRASKERLQTLGPDFYIERLVKKHLLQNHALLRPPALGKEITPSKRSDATTKEQNPQTFRIAGVDEAGRGPLAGPVVAGAVILEETRIPALLDDSKKLSAQQRERLFNALLASHTVGVAWATPARIDAMNIRHATLWAMRQAICALGAPLDCALIDGKDVPEALPCPGLAVIKGDGLCLSIAAASIIAKVMRDRIMQVCAKEAGAYAFNTNMGYGTQKHREALYQHGPGRHHRRSFRPVRDLVKEL